MGAQGLILRSHNKIAAPNLESPLDTGARLRGRKTARASKKCSEKVLGGRVLRRVLRKCLAMGFKGVKKKVLRRVPRRGS